jgi:hypothetical protein
MDEKFKVWLNLAWALLLVATQPLTIFTIANLPHYS